MAGRKLPNVIAWRCAFTRRQISERPPARRLRQYLRPPNRRTVKNLTICEQYLGLIQRLAPKLRHTLSGLDAIPAKALPRHSLRPAVDVCPNGALPGRPAGCGETARKHCGNGSK